MSSDTKLGGRPQRGSSGTSRLLTAGVICLAIMATPALSLASGPTRQTPAIGQGRALSAATLTANDDARLHPVTSSGSSIIEEGTATGSLPGHVRASINIGNPILVRFTIYGHGWSITGEASAELKGNHQEPSFSGHMTVRSGSGRFKHAHGSGNFYGTLNWATKRGTVQTRGSLHY